MSDKECKHFLTENFKIGPISERWGTCLLCGEDMKMPPPPKIKRKKK